MVSRGFPTIMINFELAFLIKLSLSLSLTGRALACATYTVTVSIPFWSLEGSLSPLPRSR